jgi:hypothetical protein
MQRELVVHIGLPKTGSTALQNFLSRNRAVLLESSLDYLPIGEFNEGASGQIASGNGAFVARSMLPPEDPAFLPWDEPRIGAEFEKAVEASKANRLLISSELFALPRIDAWGKLMALCDRHKLALRIVAAVRNPSDWLSSAYLQDIKRRQMTRDPEDYIRDLYRSTRFLYFDTYFRDYVKLAGGGVELISFDQTAFKNELVTDVLTRLGVKNAQGFAKQEPINVSPNPEEIAFLRICNRYGPNMNFSDILAKAPGHGRTNGDASKSDHRWTVISPELEHEISKHFSEEIARFRASFRLNEQFFSQPCRNYVDLKSLSISTGALGDLLGRYLIAYDQRLRSIGTQLQALEHAIKRNGHH